MTADECVYLNSKSTARVARSLSEQCRIILHCADGLQSRVASELDVHEHTGGKSRRRFLADCIEGLLDEARPGKPARHRRPLGRFSDRADAEHHPAMRRNHKIAKVAHRPHCYVHFKPTSVSWINQVKRWFAEFSASVKRFYQKTERSYAADLSFI